MTHDEVWDGVNPPIVKILKGSILFQSFCTKKASWEEIITLANKHHNPGTTNGWQWPTDEMLEHFCEVNNAKFDIDPPMSVKEFKEGIPCQNHKGYKHYLLVL